MWNLIAKAVHASGAIELTILFLLIGFSVASWGVILMKIRGLGVAARNNRKLRSLFDQNESVGEFTPPPVEGPAPLKAIFDAAVDTLEHGRRGTKIALTPEKLHEKVMLRMQHTAKDEMNQLRIGSGFLVSVGSVSPFIGLFGTVWGIMATFQALGDARSASLNVVAPGISSALIATAAGLAVAIPAVMAYNWILGRIDLLEEEASTFIERMDFMTRVEFTGGAATPMAANTANGEATRTGLSEPVLAAR